MKKKILLFTATAGMLSIALLSNNSGPAGTTPVGGNRTGALASGTCADPGNGCHTQNTATLGSFSKIIDKANGWDVTTHGYIEGHTYTVTLQGTNVSKVNFGFQASALWDADQKQAGTLTATASQTAVRPTKLSLSSLDTTYVVEHTNKLPGTSGIINVNFDWTAPPVGTNKGAVKFWGVVNAVDGDATSAGDQVSASFNRTLANVTSVEDLRNTPNVKIWPNPLVGDNRLKIELKNAYTGAYTITAFDMSGRKMFTEKYTTNVMPFEYNTSNWTPGIYHLQIINDEGMTHTTPLIKY